MKAALKRLLGVFFLIFVAPCHAETLQIHTPFDKFNLELNNGQLTVSGKPADSRVVPSVLSTLDSPLVNECGKLPAKPLLTVIKKNQKRFIYPDQGVISDGSKCLNVTGDGLFYFPIHRDFLVGPERGQISVGPTLTVIRNGTKILDVRNTAMGWENEIPSQLPNWEFVEKLEKSLSDHDIRLRVQTGLTRGKSKVVIQTGGRNYEFFKISQVMWGVRKKDDQWLTVSDAWSEWRDFDEDLLNDPQTGKIRLIGDEQKPADKRLEALESLENLWSPNLRDLCERIVLNADENSRLRELAFKNLKRRPTLRTAGVMVRLLETPQEMDWKRKAAATLRLQDPAGPKFEPSSSDEAQHKVIEFWRNWWKQKSQTP